MKRAILVVFGTAAALPFAIVACKTQSTEVVTASASVSASVSAPASASVAAFASASASASASGAASASVSAKPDCGTAFNAMQAGPDAVRRRYASCTSDSDCALVWGRACLASCDTAINSKGVAEYDRAIKATEPACSAWMSGACIRSYPIAVPTCPPMTPKCENGKCVAHAR